MIHNTITRPYSPNDKTSLMEIMKLNVPTYFAESEIVDLERYLDQEIEQYFVMEKEGRLLGAGGINFDKNKKHAKISWDLVHPNHQGKGLGSDLLLYRLDLLKEMKHLESITVRTSQFVYPFYAKYGFVLKTVKEDFWAKGFDLYEMKFEQARKAI